jgi:hypothetical protein
MHRLRPTKTTAAAVVDAKREFARLQAETYAAEQKVKALEARGSAIQI